MAINIFKKSKYLMIIVSIFTLSLAIGYQLDADSERLKFGNPVVEAADEGSVEDLVELLRSGHLVDEVGILGTTGLMRASYRGNRSLVNLLLSIGADPNLQDIGGATALHLAAREGKDEIVVLLLKEKVEIDHRDKEGWTPLMRAIQNDHYEVTRVLLENQAQILPKNRWNKDALHYAILNNNQELLELLSLNLANILTDSETRRAIVERMNASGRNNIIALAEQYFSEPKQEMIDAHQIAVGEDDERLSEEKILRFSDLFRKIFTLRTEEFQQMELEEVPITVEEHLPEEMKFSEDMQDQKTFNNFFKWLYRNAEKVGDRAEVIVVKKTKLQIEELPEFDAEVPVNIDRIEDLESELMQVFGELDSWEFKSRAEPNKLLTMVREDKNIHGYCLKHVGKAKAMNPDLHEFTLNYVVDNENILRAVDFTDKDNLSHLCESLTKGRERFKIKNITTTNQD